MCIQTELPIHPERLEPDVYGQRHSVETPELIETSLRLLEATLESIPPKDKVCAATAKKRCPELLTPRFMLMFLRCEVFNVELAATRYVKYWEKRVEIFGEEKAYKALTFGNLVSGDEDVMKILDRRVYSVVRVAGRLVFCGEYDRTDPTQYSRYAMVRLIWYFIHVALEDEETQKRGLIVIANMKHASLKNLDRKLAKLNISCIKGALPMRLSACHICYPPSCASFVYGILKVFLNERLRKRVLFHSGDEKTVVDKLSATYGMAVSDLPRTIGGDFDSEREMAALIVARKAVEASS